MTSQQKTTVGVIGCGHISTVYFNTLRQFDILQVVACADLDIERAKAQAEKFAIPKACSVAELLADPSIEIVVNLTVPNAHAEVAMAVLEAGKAVYSEKPLATKREQGKAILELAAQKGLRVGNAPDTFLGGGLQTCLQLINNGEIGQPIAATAFILNHGMEHWHPDPYFFYQPGAGPLFDVGPYYLTTLVTMMGPVRRVSGTASTTFPERTVTSEAKYGTKIPVNTPTHIAGLLDFANGAVGTILTSFDVWHHRLPFIEIYGSEGTLSTPDPNRFDGPVYLRKAHDKEWREIPLTHGYITNMRGLGVVDMAYAMRTGRPHRANGEMAYHILDIIESIMQSSEEGRHIELTSSCTRPEPLAPGDSPWEANIAALSEQENQSTK